MLLPRPATLLLAALVSAVALSGCAPSRGLVPFRAYEASFAKVRDASEALLDRVALAERAQARRVIARQSPAGIDIGVEPFRPTQHVYYATGIDPPLTAACRSAIAAVSAYNATLLAMAEGRGLDELKAGAGRFGAEVSGLLTLVGAGGSLAPIRAALVALGPAIDEALKAASRAAFEEAFLRNFDTVDSILALLAGDVAVELEAKLTTDKRNALVNHTTGLRRLSNDQVARLREEIQAADTAIYDWIALIEQARRAMAATRTALTAPVAPDIHANELADSAARIRVLAASVKSALMHLQ